MAQTFYFSEQPGFSKLSRSRAPCLWPHPPDLADSSPPGGPETDGGFKTEPFQTNVMSPPSFSSPFLFLSLEGASRGENSVGRGAAPRGPDPAGDHPGLDDSPPPGGLETN